MKGIVFTQYAFIRIFASSLQSVDVYFIIEWEVKYDYVFSADKTLPYVICVAKSRMPGI